MLGWKPWGLVPSALDLPTSTCSSFWALAQVGGPSVVPLGCLGDKAGSDSPATSLSIHPRGDYYLLL